MLHSSEQLKREHEYARRNREYLEEKRERLQAFNYHGENKEENKRRRVNKLCCFIAGVVLIFSAYGIYYFIMSVKGPLIDDYYKKKNQVHEILPQGVDEVKKGIDQGQQLLDETQKNAADIQNKIDETKATIDNVQQKADQAKQTYDEIKDVKEKVEALIK